MNRLNLFVTDDYTDKEGEKKTSYTQVGNIVPHKDGEGVNIYITPGISVTGVLVAFPPKEKPVKE